MTDENWERDFEPGSRNYDIGLQPLVSIAISLKRIADTLDGTTLGISISDTLFNTKR